MEAYALKHIKSELFIKVKTVSGYNIDWPDHGKCYYNGDWNELQCNHGDIQNAYHWYTWETFKQLSEEKYEAQRDPRYLLAFLNDKENKFFRPESLQKEDYKVVRFSLETFEILEEIETSNLTFLQKPQPALKPGTEMNGNSVPNLHFYTDFIHIFQNVPSGSVNPQSFAPNFPMMKCVHVLQEKKAQLKINEIRENVFNARFIYLGKTLTPKNIATLERVITETPTKA
jgi:hypothetical protein